MKFCLRIALLTFLLTGSLTQDLFDLGDALGPDPTPAKPKEKPKPKADDYVGFDLAGALDPDPTDTTEKPPVKPPKSGGGGGGGGGGGDFGFDLEDALKPDPNPKPDKPVNPRPPHDGGGGGSFGDADLLDVSTGGDYKPDGGRSGGGGAVDPGNDPHGGADQPQETGSGQIAGIASAIGVALFGAVSSYVAYQKKKLCFKLQGGVDPESGKGRHGTQSDPQGWSQVMSNLLRTS